MQVKIEGAQKLKNKLLALVKKYGGDPKEEIVVGFAQSYALYVHEINAYHKVGQWKYLETPAKQLKPEIARIIQSALERKVPLIQALMLGGLRLQRAAQQLTPVDTSALKASAFTCTQSQLDMVSQEAFQKSEAIRKSGQ